MGVRFHSEDTRYTFSHKNKHKSWIRHYFASLGRTIGEINVVFTSNTKILQLNQQYLNHNYFTDVITFDYSGGESLSGDVFISIDQVRENAQAYGAPLDDELRRVMVHGMLHLAGFGDATEAEQVIMREKENDALHLWLKLEE